MAFRFLVLACVLLFQVRAADTEIAGSVLGFFFDRANGLQPILGAPGAATVGPPIDLQRQISSATFSSQQDYALAITDSDTALLSIALDGSAAVRRSGISIPPAALIELSPNGSAAAIYDSGQKRVQVITGLPEFPVVAREFDLSAFAGTLLCLAISDGGEVALAGLSDSVLSLASDGSMRPLPALQRATAARFLPKSTGAVIADRAANAIYVLTDAMGAAEPTLLAGEPEGIADPVAVATSSDGKRVFAANARSRTVAAMELGGGAVTVVSCPCDPSLLAALSGNAVFRLNQPSGGPLWLFDGDSSQPRIVFVPPYRPMEDRAR